ncbi:hypothetical protein [Arenibaculum pallidiluteum]|uniref:hypothetical protein n=1 Tax=Arenibaculum pallidiluteum TaxID=2812559 RepID=UPI001A977C33|nr:hypothetical protein [Arenibaculum pallidiluteum]
MASRRPAPPPSNHELHARRFAAAVARGVSRDARPLPEPTELPGGLLAFPEVVSYAAEDGTLSPVPPAGEGARYRAVVHDVAMYDRLVSAGAIGPRSFWSR